MTFDYGGDRFFQADSSFKRTQLETVTLNDPVVVRVVNLQSLLDENSESMRVIKVAISLSLVTRADKLTVEHITTTAEKIKNDTWVVTEIWQGFELFIVLEKKVAAGDNVEQLLHELLDVAKQISEGNEIASDLKGLSVEVRGDIGHYDSNALTTGSISILERFSQLLQNNKETATPKFAVLRWIKKPNDPPSQEVATVDVDMKQIENLLSCFDVFQVLKWRLAGLISLAAGNKFKWIQQDLRAVADLLNREPKILVQKVLEATNKHRKSSPDKSGTGETICRYQQMVPDCWWSNKEREIKILNGWLKMLSTVEFCPSFEFVEEKFGDCATLYSLEINIAAVQDPFTSALPSRTPIDISERKWWFDSKTEISLGKLIRNFVDLAENVRSDERKKFVFGCFDKENCAVIECVCYENGEPRHFFPPPTPKVLHAEEITTNSVKLSWEMPGLDQGITHFLCAYRLRDPDSDATKWHETRTSGPVRNMTLRNLRSDCEYEFKVASVSDVGSSKYVELRGAVQTLIAETTVPERASIPFLHSDNRKVLIDLIKGSIPITSTNPIVHQLKRDPIFFDDTKQIYRYVYGEKSTAMPIEKVILILGVTGGGKSTLIDAIFNFVCGVKFEDNIRLKVTRSIPKELGCSDTQSIGIYTVYLEVEGSSQYVLTVIDTPGFMDTTGPERDAQLQEQLHQLFSNSGSGGIDHIDAVGIITPSSASRITVAQRYIFNCITKVFAKDIVENIFILCTFADDKEPVVIDAITAANVPFKKCFLFNNCALFKEKTGNMAFTAQFWEMGQKGISDFLEELRNIVPKSISMSRDVLEERFRLELNMDRLMFQIQKKLGKVQEIEETQAVLKMHREDIDKNQDFDIFVNVPEVIEENQDNFLTRLWHGDPFNCKVCKTTCGRVSKIPYFRTQFKSCEVCPKKCDWEQHERQKSVILRVKMVKKKRTINEMKEKYGIAVDEAGQAERLLQALNTFLREVNDRVTSLVESMHKTIKRLNEIALRPNVNSSCEMIEFLIQTEQQERKVGYQDRIAMLLIIKKRADILEGIAQALEDTKV